MQTGHRGRRPVELATIKKMQDDINMMRATQAEHDGHVHADMASIKDAVITHNAQSR